jgi:hypothetical protein
MLFDGSLVRRLAGPNSTSGTRIGIGLLLVANTAAALRFLWFAARVLPFPYPLDYGEGAILDQALRLAHFENIYPFDLAHAPYVVSNYPPIFIMLHVPFLWAFGPAYWYGRLLSQISAVLCSVAIGGILLRLTEDRLAAVVAGLAFLCLPPVVVFGQFDRVDMVGLALSLTALWLVVGQPAGSRGIVGASLLMVAAIYTRQSYLLTAPVTAIVWLLSQRRPRAAVVFTVIVGLSCLMAMVALNAATAGGFFFHTVTATRGSMSVNRLRFFVQLLGRMYPLGALLVALAVCLAVWTRPPWAPAIATYLLCSLVATLAVAKHGSTINYFLEISAGASFSIGVLLAEMRGIRWAFLMLISAVTVQNVMVAAGNDIYTPLIGRLHHQREWRRLFARVRGTEAPILADEPLGLLPLAGRRLYYQPFAMTELADEGLWSDADLVAEIAAKRFGLILIMDPDRPVRSFWTPALTAAVRDSYHQTATVSIDDEFHVGVLVPSP